MLLPLRVVARVSPGPQSTIVSERVTGAPVGPGVVVRDVDVLQFSRPDGPSARPLLLVVLELLSDLLPSGPIVVVLLELLVCASAVPAASIAAKAKTTCFMAISFSLGHTTFRCAEGSISGLSTIDIRNPLF